MTNAQRKARAARVRNLIQGEPASPVPPVIKTDLLTLHAGVSTDTLNGERITHGTIPFGLLFIGTAEVKGQTIDIIASGPSLALRSGKRYVSINIEYVIEEGIKLGLLDKTIDFKSNPSGGWTK